MNKQRDEEVRNELIDGLRAANSLVWKRNVELRAELEEQNEVLRECYNFIADQYGSAEAQALEGEYVAKEARPLWDKLCNILAKDT